VPEPPDNQMPARSFREEGPGKWSAPIDVRVLFAFGIIGLSYLFFHGFVESLLNSVQFFATGQRRLGASAILIFIFAIFCLYLRYRKPFWRGWHGSKEKLERPKLRHMLYLLGTLGYIWVPTLPGLMPRSTLEQAIRSEIPRDLRVLQEKIVVADRHYRSMLDDEERAEKFATFSRPVQLSLRPPMPYAGMAERLQADLPPLGIEAAQREHELEAAGEQFQIYAQIYRRLAETEDREREALSFFRNSWQHYAEIAAWTTPIPAYRKVYRFLIIGVYLRTLRELEPQLRSVGLSPIEMPRDLMVTKDPLSVAEQRRLDNGIPPEFDNGDFTPLEVHVGHPSLR
jgi:hypothetical protein